MQTNFDALASDLNNGPDALSGVLKDPGIISLAEKLGLDLSNPSHIQMLVKRAQVKVKQMQEGIIPPLPGLQGNVVSANYGRPYIKKAIAHYHSVAGYNH
ncbi:hypothetical protein LC612_31680 [Nostoc sp. CHAB 5834]|nr:hypothetical protein [Nostoc sp. CHAB 5834]